MAQAGEKEAQRGPLLSLQLPERRGQPGGGQALLLWKKSSNKTKQPQAVPGGIQVGHQGKFLPCKGCQAVNQAA